MLIATKSSFRFQFDQVLDSAVTSNRSVGPEIIRSFTIDLLEGRSCAIVSLDAGSAGSHSWLLGSDLSFETWAA